MVPLPRGVPPQAFTLGLVAPAQPARVLSMRIVFDIRKKPEWQKWQEEFKDPKSPHYRKFMTTEDEVGSLAETDQHYLVSEIVVGLPWI